MRRIICSVVLACLVGASSGCIIPIYDGEPQRRAQQLLYTSENLRMINDEWERIWFLDMPSHTGPVRVHGGLM